MSDLNISKTGKTVNNGDTINIRSTLAKTDFSDANTGGTKVDFAAANAADVKLAQDKSGKYYATGDNGTTYYAATVDNKTGKVSIDSRNPASNTTGLALTTVTEVGKDVTADTTALTAANKSLVTYKDQSGNAAYAVKTVDGNGVESYKNATFTGGVAGEGTTVLSLGTTDPLKKIDKALSDVDQFRSSLGAIQNRFESAITSTGNTVNNLSSARSRIEDSDYATEVSNMSRAQILQQAGTSVLAQANQTTQNVLSLLR